MTELLAQVPVDFICLGILGALLLRKLVRMEGFHWLRVVILTALLWVSAVYLFLLGGLPLFEPGCVPCSECALYTCAEM